MGAHILRWCRWWWLMVMVKRKKMTKTRVVRHGAIEQRINFIVKLQNYYVFLVNRLGISSIKLCIIGLTIVYWVFFDGLFFFPSFCSCYSIPSFALFYISIARWSGLSPNLFSRSWGMHYDISKYSTLKYERIEEWLIIIVAFV